MNNIYITSISKKRQTGEFIIKKEHFSHKEIKEIVHLIRDVFEMRGIERVSKEMKGFLHNYPNGSYVKFTLKLDHDFSVISSGGGLLGYISDSVYDAYDTFVFSNVDCFIPPVGYHLKSIDELKSKWTSINQIVPLIDYKQDPSILSKQHEHPKVSYAYQPRVVQPSFSPKQLAQQHTAVNQQLEREALTKISLSSSPSKTTSTSLKSKTIKENGSLHVSSPPISVRGF